MNGHEFTEFWPQNHASSLFYHNNNNLNMPFGDSQQGSQIRSNGEGEMPSMDNSHGHTQNNSFLSPETIFNGHNDQQQNHFNSFQMMGMDAASSAAQLLAGIQHHNLSHFQHSALPPSFMQLNLHAAAAACAKEYNEPDQHRQSPVAMFDLDHQANTSGRNQVRQDLDRLLNQSRETANLPEISEMTHMQTAVEHQNIQGIQNNISAGIQQNLQPPASESTTSAADNLLSPLFPLNPFESRPPLVNQIDLMLNNMSQPQHQGAIHELDHGFGPKDVMNDKEMMRNHEKMFMERKKIKEENLQREKLMTKDSRNNSPPVCQVCLSGPSNGLHFGAPRTCAACAAFFRRTISDQKKYICKRPQRCTMKFSESAGYRKICRNCRMKRCLEIGMLPDKVQHKRNRRDFMSFRSKMDSKPSNEMLSISQGFPQMHHEHNGHLESVSSLLPPNPWPSINQVGFSGL
ncbi:unnamed protein product [Bursaphelenchus xylophilus]|uniref:(pine wood nematode) hypothetical protein n=1 Tax=Bursaphelenchus xylophilus TaxID=6326 RepID=A0A1I7RRC8_BURXY|nr:unnamed protein product [Bursaphelenchus xylophilus]CAG9130946.1 unnamed protein product [Bursaphelenchus xylophilus]